MWIKVWLAGLREKNGVFVDENDVPCSKLAKTQELVVWGFRLKQSTNICARHSCFFRDQSIFISSR